MTSAQHEESAGGPDVVDLLHELHEQLRDAFTDVVTAEGAGKAELFDELITLLAVHDAVEREVIHPLAERVTPASAVGTRLTEEADIEDALARLSSMAVEDEAFDVELIGVARVVTMHVQSVEREDLPRCGRRFPPRDCVLSPRRCSQHSRLPPRAHERSTRTYGLPTKSARIVCCKRSGTRSAGRTDHEGRPE